MNYNGDTCGQGALSDYKYNAWIAMPTPGLAELNGNNPSLDCTDCFFIKTCLVDCVQTQRGSASTDMIDFYPSKDYGYFCIPDPTAVAGLSQNSTIHVSFEFEGDFDAAYQNAGRAIGDLYTTWPLILGSAAVALLFAFLYNFLTETFAGVLVFFAIIIIIAGGVLASYTLIKAGRDARDQNAATHTSDAMYGTGITLAVLTLIFLLVLIAMRERIRIAIEVVKEASRCVHDIWSLIVFPIIPMVFGLGYFVFWVVVVVYLAAVWDTKEQVVPAYIQNSHQFNATNFRMNNSVPMYTYYTWDTSMQKSFAYAFFHLLWSAQFIIYFAYMVMAGTVANWYFAPRDANEKRIVGKNPGELSHTPITDSCARTCRFHIGTVALASLIIAIVQAIRAAVAYIEKKCTVANGGVPNMLQRAVFCLIHCCLACLQCCLDKINKNALVWTAIWGDSFGTAACSSFKLLWGNLGRTGAMSVVSAFLMFLGKVLIALATVGFGGIFIHFKYKDISSPVLPMVLIFIVGYTVGALFMSVFEVAMDTIFLCFLIDEKMHAASGNMCASKGLRALVDSDEIKLVSKGRAEQEHQIQENRLKQLGLSDEYNHTAGTTKQTGVLQAPAVMPNV